MSEESFIYGNVMARRQEQLQRFVNEVLSDGKSRGKAHFLSNIPFNVYQDIRRRGMHLQSDHIFLPDKSVIKYISHPKGKKGATLPFKEFWKIVNTATNPKNVYVDTKQKNLVYAFTSRYNKGRVIKIIMQPNYKYGKRKVNIITSIGVVDKRKMGNPQYLKIK